MVKNSKEYQRNYFNEHNLSCECECGGKYKTYFIHVHKKSQKHQKWLQSKRNQENPVEQAEPIEQPIKYDITDVYSKILLQNVMQLLQENITLNDKIAELQKPTN